MFDKLYSQSVFSQWSAFVDESPLLIRPRLARVMVTLRHGPRREKQFYSHSVKGQIATCGTSLVLLKEFASDTSSKD